MHGAWQYSVDGKRTTKYAEVKWGGSSRAWAMSMVSDKPATEQELREMCTEMDRLNLPPYDTQLPGPGSTSSSGSGLDFGYGSDRASILGRSGHNLGGFHVYLRAFLPLWVPNPITPSPSEP